MNTMEPSMNVSLNWWWIDSHGKESPCRSPWLRTTLAELDEKTKGMMKLIEEEADTFAKRAEMYYKKRPELITMVEDFYRRHRSLAEQYDHIRSEPTTSRLPTPCSSPLSFTKYRLEKSLNMIEKGRDIYSDHYGPEESDESVVENPEQQEEIESEEGEDEVVSSNDEDIMILRKEVQRLCKENEVHKEIIRLRETVERLREVNQVQKQQLKEKDEEKREVIRQLSLAMDVLKCENLNLRKNLVMNSDKKVEVNKSHGFVGWFLKGFSKPPH